MPYLCNAKLSAADSLPNEKRPPQEWQAFRSPTTADFFGQRLVLAFSYNGITRCAYTVKSLNRSSRVGWVDKNLKAGSPPAACPIFCHSVTAARGS